MTGHWARVAGLASLAVVGGLLTARAEGQTISVQSNRVQVGVTGGMSFDPEQAFVGVFWRSPEIGQRFHLRPGLEGGFGNDLRIGTINIDFLARFPIGTSGWDFVQGGGPAIVITRFNAFGRSDTDLGAGGSYVIGFGHENGFLTEFRIGGGNVPGLKLTAGYALAF